MDAMDAMEGTYAGGSPERPATFFTDAAAFRRWLAAHHDTATELWMGLTKRHVVPRGLTWADAVPEALCYGWIDSKSQRIDDDSLRQRWTPRKPGSVWSNINVATVARLIAEGRMTPAGLAAFEARRPERTGIYSFETDVAALPPPYLAALAAEPRAQAFWDGATPAYRKTCTHWVLSAAQQATRDKRMAELVADCAELRLVKHQRYGTEPAWVARLQRTLGDA